MKRIEFIAPVEAMRGNLGETQRDIVYPTHDNSAYDGPEGERNTARNYKPIIVGAKRANGRTYFSVRTKTTNHLTTKAKKSMATMGAACSVYAVMRKDSAIAAKMDEVFAFMIPSLPIGATMRGYFMERIVLAMNNGDELIDLSAGSIQFVVGNPYVIESPESLPSYGYWVVIPNEILVKFWEQISAQNVSFYVNGKKYIGKANMTFNDWEFSRFNDHSLKPGYIVYEGHSYQTLCLYFSSNPMPDNLDALTFENVPVSLYDKISEKNYVTKTYPRYD